MNILKDYRTWLFLLVIISLTLWLFLNNRNGTPTATTNAEIGTVTSFISVSGSADVEDIIPLSFPRGGTISGVFVSRGDEVATGTILATVGDTALQADYAAALAEVTRTRAIRNQLLNGQTEEEAVVTDTVVKNAEESLINTIRTEASRVETVRTTLYSTGLTAVANSPDTAGAPPTISGSYTCTAEGTYTLELYRSGTLSGYSYRYSGIETGTGNASTNQPTPLGECGLRLQFPADTTYPSNTIFTISIPNTTNSSYATNRALYDQALAQEEANINAARRTLDLALNQATVSTAGPRIEQLIATNAVVAAAEARLTQTSFALSESAIRAPSSGIITNVNVATGQTIATEPAVTLFSPIRTTFTARVPEVDIRILNIGQTAELSFDADRENTVLGTIDFISPLPTTIDGVAYFEAMILLETTPAWLRNGMNADVKIITEVTENITRIPRRYVNPDSTVTVKNGNQTKRQPITIIHNGSDGFVGISGVAAGTTLIAE